MRNLAQLAFSAFLQAPFKAKDKKKTLFNKDGSDAEYLINEYYDEIFIFPKKTIKKASCSREVKKKSMKLCS